MYYIELKSLIAEVEGEGHTVMSIFNGELVYTALFRTLLTRYSDKIIRGEKIIIPREKQTKMIPEIVNISEAFVVYHPIDDKKVTILRGTVCNNHIFYPSLDCLQHKKVDYEEFRPYFEELNDGRTEGQLSMPEFRRFVNAEGLASLLSDVPEI